MKRQRVANDEEGAIAPPSFSFDPALPCEYSVEHDGRSNDGYDYVLRLRRPYVRRAIAHEHRLNVQPAICAIGLAPPAAFAAGGGGMDRTTLLDRVYHTYETHTLALDESEQVVLAVYISLDVNARGNGLELRFNLEMRWMQQQFGIERYQALPWFPPDVDPTQYGLKVDAKRIPQRTPLWFKLRGSVTGTKAYKYSGYWMPSRAAAPNWTIDGEETFSAASLANMRLGKRSELSAVCGYLTVRPKVTLSAVGWCDAPRPYPLGWGASPDALIHDPTMDWTQVPTDIAKYYVNNKLDVTRGVLEIKTTTRSLGFEPYFLPQVYMEMIAANVVWCDLMRFFPSPPEGRGGRGGKARIYRVFRHPPTEELIMGLVRNAIALPPDKVQDTVLEDERYVKARQFIKEVAQTLPFVEVETPSFEAEWEAYKARLVEAPTALPAPVGGGELRAALKRVREALDALEALL